jgi:hypothetical protein
VPAIVDEGITTMALKGTTNNKNTFSKFIESLGWQVETTTEKGIAQNEQDEQERNVGGDSCSLLFAPPPFSDLVVDDED